MESATDPGISLRPLVLACAPGEAHVVVRAEYFEGLINLKAFAAAHPEYRVLAGDPLVIEPEAGVFVVLLKFGAVVFWGGPEPLIARIMEEVRRLPDVGAPVDAVRDTLAVHVGAQEDNVDFQQLSLRRLTLEHLSIASIALAQSVALESFELRVSEAVRKAEPIVRGLRRHGRIQVPEREIMRTIGFALAVRSAVLSNLTLFDNPPETWQSEALSRLDSRLYDHFDLEERLSAINQKVAFLSDLNTLLMDLLQNRKSNRLEWIIIILIAVEIVFFALLEAAR